MSAIPVTGTRRRRGSVYARHSTKRQHSIEDQVRKCLEWADKNGVDVRPDHIFTDEAITGRSNDRSGLDQLKQALAKDEVDKALKYWYTSRGLPVPDGRLRRFQLEHQDPKAYLF